MLIIVSFFVSIKYTLTIFLIVKRYNLDGGGSSTMWFMGDVVNNPTTNGNSISERKVSDIVYIGQ